MLKEVFVLLSWVNYIPNSYVEVLTLITSESDLIWKLGHADVISQDEVIVE